MSFSALCSHDSWRENLISCLSELMLLRQQGKLFKTNICKHSEIRKHTGPPRVHALERLSDGVNNMIVAHIPLCVSACRLCVYVWAQLGWRGMLSVSRVLSHCDMLLPCGVPVTLLLLTWPKKKRMESTVLFVCACVLLFCLCKDSQLLHVFGMFRWSTFCSLLAQNWPH